MGGGFWNKEMRIGSLLEEYLVHASLPPIKKEFDAF